MKRIEFEKEFDLKKEIGELSDSISWLSDKQEELKGFLNEFTLSQRELIKELLPKIEYLEHDTENIYLKNIVERVIKYWKLNPIETAFIAPAKGSDIDSSHSVVQRLKMTVPLLRSLNTNIDKLSYFSSLDHLIKPSDSDMGKIGRSKNFVLVDDFIGSGNSIITSLMKLIAKYGETKKYYLCAFVSMAKAIDRINETDNEYYICHKPLNKGISDNYTGKGFENAVVLMKEMEKNLSSKWDGKYSSKYSFGFGRAEALFAFENGYSPNNVFPIFWWKFDVKGKVRSTILYRNSP